MLCTTLISVVTACGLMCRHLTYLAPSSGVQPIADSFLTYTSNVTLIHDRKWDECFLPSVGALKTFRENDLFQWQDKNEHLIWKSRVVTVSPKKQAKQEKHAALRIARDKPSKPSKPSLQTLARAVQATSRVLQKKMGNLRSQLSVKSPLQQATRKKIQNDLRQTQHQVAVQTKQLLAVRQAIQLVKQAKTLKTRLDKAKHPKQISTLSTQLATVKKQEKVVFQRVDTIASIVAQKKAVKEVQTEIKKEDRQDEGKKEKRLPNQVKKNNDDDESKSSTVEKHDEDEEEDEEEDDEEHWKKHVHLDLHDDVKDFVKARRESPSRPAHKAVRFFNKKVHAWWNDDEEDTEHDRRKMKHIFHALRAHRKLQ